MSDPKYHPVSGIFPLMTGAPFDELVADIKANGLREPIWLYCEKIIDGRNRYRACEAAGVEPAYREWGGKGDLTKFVVSMNLHRRHLDEAQRSVVAAKIADRPHGNQPKNGDRQICLSSPTVGEAAEMLNVSPRSVRTAKRVLRDAAPEVVAAVEAGDLSLHAADEIAAEPVEDQAVALMERTRPSDARKQRKPVVRGSFDEAADMIEVFRQVSVSLKTIEKMKPKRTMAIEVAEAARAVISRLERIISNIEKG